MVSEVKSAEIEKLLFLWAAKVEFCAGQKRIGRKENTDSNADIDTLSVGPDRQKSKGEHAGDSAGENCVQSEDCPEDCFSA